jgi:hypothetical protein
MDEVASLNERVAVMAEDAERMRGELATSLDVGRALERSLEGERSAHRRLRQEYQETRMLVDGLVGLVGELRDDLTRHVVQSGRARRRAETPIPQELIDFGGRLVPIGEPDRAESRTSSSTGLSREVEIIDLTDDGPDDVFDDVPDFMAEERRQAEEAVERGEVTSAAEIRMAQADPSPEYEHAPDYEDAPDYEPRSSPEV